jgi:type VI secretion system protein ImpH
MMLLERLTQPGVPRCSFFTAVRLLEQVTVDAPRVGGEGPFSAETVSFRHSPSFSSQPNELESIRKVEAPRTAEQLLEGRRHRYQVTTCFLGLSGADSPLPLFHAADMLSDEEWARKQVHFLDVFHNRMTALFYRAVTKYDYPRECESTAIDPSSTRALTMAGLDLEGDPEDSITRPEFLRLAALFTLGGATARSIENALRVMLSEALGGISLRLTQFTGGWVTYDQSQTNKLGRANNRMADSFMLGTRVRHPAHRAKITIGPMNPEEARHFSPGGASFLRIRKLVHAMCGEPLVFDLELLIREGQYPPFVLGRRTLGHDVCITAKKDSGRIATRIYDLDKTYPVKKGAGEDGKAKDR